MKKQTLFNLASMPRLVSTVVLIVMIGALFGLISYSNKKPKINLPILNPVVEDQCEIDSDCKLISVGGCPCNTSDEEFKCFLTEEAIEKEKQRLDDPKKVLCSKCPQPLEIQHTCQCKNGKCEKIKKELVEEVSVTTDKTEYGQGEEVKITVKNNLSNTIKHLEGIGCGLQGFSNKKNEWINALSKSCEWDGEGRLKPDSEYSFNWVVSGSGLEKYRIVFYYQEQELVETKEIGKIICENQNVPNELKTLLLNGKWIKNDVEPCEMCMACGCGCVEKNIWSIGEVSIDVHHTSCWGDSYKIKYKGEEYNCMSENYKPLYEQASIYPKIPEGWSTVYSNEFTIKEKSALDARCEEKVVGVGQIFTDEGVVTSCNLILLGYEFDKDKEVCIEKSVNGCSVKTPFDTLEECREVCEKSNMSKVGSYLAFLMSDKDKDAGRQYEVDIEFSGELFDEELAEIESNYDLIFNRLPNGSIAHSLQFYGAKISDYAISQLIERLDVIKIESTGKPVSVPE